MRARVFKDDHWWTVAYDGRNIGRFRYWCHAMKHARCVVELARRGEPTA